MRQGDCCAVFPDLDNHAQSLVVCAYRSLGQPCRWCTDGVLSTITNITLKNAGLSMGMGTKDHYKSSKPHLREAYRTHYTGFLICWMAVANSILDLEGRVFQLSKLMNAFNKSLFPPWIRSYGL